MNALRTLVAALRRWRIRRETYRVLIDLDDWLLYDIGLERSQIPEVVDGLLKPRPTTSVSTVVPFATAVSQQTAARQAANDSKPPRAA